MYEQIPHQCYYKVLGVDRYASIDEIKTAFRILSKQTHPDVSGSKSTIEQFKKISVAASVLTNPKQKLQYDKMIQYYKQDGIGSYNIYDDDNIYKRTAYKRNSSNINESFWDSDYRRAKSSYKHYEQQQQQHHQHNARGFYTMLETIVRPRNLVLGPVLLYAAVYGIEYLKHQFLIYTDTTYINITDTKKHQQQIKPNISIFRRGDNERVQAWYNPTTDQYETPAPWDKTYQQLQPQLELVPRYLVKPRTR